MNRIYTGFVSDPNIQQPFTAKSLDFVQDSVKEQVKAVCYGKIGGSLAGYQQVTGGAIISGCNYSGSGNTIYNGFILWQDELYYFPGAMGLLSYTNVPVVVLDEYNDVSIDPVEFSDNVFRSVHKVRRLKVVDQVSGSGLFDLSKLQGVIKETTVVGTATTTTSATAVAIPNASYTATRTIDIEITVTGRITCTADGAAEQGGILTVQNLTTNAVLSQTAASVGATVPNGQVYKFPASLTLVCRNVPAGTQIGAVIQRINNNNATIDNVYFTYKELTDAN